MKYLLIIGLLTLQVSVHSQTTRNQPTITTVDNSKPKEVTVREFLKQLTAINQNTPGEMLTVAFCSKDKDPIAIKYNGDTNPDLKKAIDLLEDGDKILVQAQNKQTTIASQTFLIKK